MIHYINPKDSILEIWDVVRRKAYRIGPVTPYGWSWSGDGRSILIYESRAFHRHLLPPALLALTH